MSFVEGVKNFCDIINHPRESYRKMVRFNGIVSERDGLQTDKTGLQTKNYELGRRVENLGISLAKTKTSYAELDLKYTKLDGDVFAAKTLVDKALKACLSVHTNMGVIEDRVEGNRGNTEALGKWQNAYAGPLEKRLGAAEERSVFLEKNSYGIATDVAINTVINLDSRIKKVPFIFYNSVTKHLTYTPETLKFFGISEKEAESLNFTKLLRKVDREYLQGPDGILSALDTGTKLSHHDAKTCGENSIDLKLTTYPVKEGNKNLGIGILLYDPKVSLKSKRNRNLIESLDKIFYEVVEELNTRFGELSGQGNLGSA